MASGRPSSRRQISTTASAFFGVSAKSGRPAAARWTNSAIDAHSISVGRRGERVGRRERQRRDRELLLAVDVQHEAAGHQHLERRDRRRAAPARAPRHRTPARSCPSAGASRPRLRRCSAIAFTSGRSPLSRTPSDRATADATSRGSAIGARLTNDDAAVEVRRRDRRRPGWPGASCRCRPARSASAAGRRDRAACP